MDSMATSSPLSVKDKTGGFLCPVCGQAGTFDEHCFDERGGVIGSAICPCCFYEPGFDDDPMASAKAKATPIESIKAYRAEWIADGKPWRSASLSAPEDWDALTQLQSLLKLAPDLR